MPLEEWRAAPGWAAYEVSSRGRVRRGGRLLKPARDKDGYRHVTLSAGPERWRVHVGRLVLMAFVGWPPEGAEACHKNGRRWDNRAANLYWGTKPQNRADRERHRRAREAREAREADSAATAPCPEKTLMPQGGNRR
jgi:NUMOD4 motif/HNH endonuclease